MNIYCINPNRTKYSCVAMSKSVQKCPINCCEKVNSFIDDIVVKPHCSTSLLISNHPQEESFMEKATNTIFHDTYSTYMLIDRKTNLIKNIRDQALKVVSSSLFYSKRLMGSKFLNLDDKFNLVINTNYQSSMVGNYLKQSPKKDNARINLIIQSTDNPDNLFSLACNGYLSTKEKTILYNECGQYYFNKFKRNFKSYYLYCKVFHRQVSTFEKEILYNKLTERKNYRYVSEAIKLFNFPKTELEILESIHIAMILAN